MLGVISCAEQRYSMFCRQKEAAVTASLSIEWLEVAAKWPQKANLKAHKCRVRLCLYNVAYGLDAL